MSRRHEQFGFTLVELVIVIALTGIVAVVGAVLIQGTVSGYVDQDRRAGLVADADRALRRMAREIRQGLPNSLQVNVSQCGGDPCVQFLRTVAGGRYREGPGPAPVGGNQNRRLQFNQPDTQFNSTGPAGLADGNYPGLFLSVYNTGQAGNSAWAGQSMTPNPGLSLADDGPVSGETRVTLNNAHQFPLSSPRQRFYLVEGPVAFTCNGSNLDRHAGYGLGNQHSSVPGRTLTGSVESCSFTYTDGSSSRVGLLTMTLVLEEGSEQIRLQHQVQVVNAP